MNSMIRLTTIVSYGLCFSLWFFTGCSSSNDPKPFDCDTSDLAIDLVSKDNPTNCGSNDGSIVVVATGGQEPYTYSKNGTTFQSTATFTELGGGDFTIYVKDKNGCKKSLGVPLVIPGDNPLTALSNVTPDTECVGSNGAIEIVASGGTGPYKYKIGSGSFVDNATFPALAPGTYSLSVRDNLNCVFTLSATVIQGSTGVSYNGEIKAIFDAKCQGSGCHPSNGDWFTYNTAKANASQIKSRTQSGNMPPGGLSSEQKALIACWVDEGAPQ